VTGKLVHKTDRGDWRFEWRWSDDKQEVLCDGYFKGEAKPSFEWAFPKGHPLAAQACVFDDTALMYAERERTKS